MKLLIGVLALVICSATVASAQDVCAPSKITSITIGTGKTTAAFNWVNSGDDCNTGTATTFEVRVSTSLITDTNWQSATVKATGSPGGNGSDQCTSITGLSCGTTYYWVIFLIDDAGNRSPLSTVVQQATNGCETSLEQLCD